MAKKLYRIDPVEEVDTKDLINASEEHYFPKKRQSRGLFWVLFVVGIGLFLFVASYWYGNVKKSVGYDIPDYIAKQLNNDQNTEQTIEDLKNKDTDRDGLSDFTELYQTHTSIFLEDTDSDGVKDAQETSEGTDPLCPSGQECSLLQLITPENKLADILQNTAIDTDVTLQKAALNEFRQFLLDNGLSKEEVASLSDEDLMAIFEALTESEIIPSDAWTSTTTPEQVRQFLLIQPGADTAAIKAMSTQELIKLRDNLLKK